MIIFAVLAIAVLAEGYPGQRPQGGTVFMQMCEKNGVSYRVVESAAMNFVYCMEDKFGIRMFEKEFNEARNFGTYNRLFEKYCAKTPQLKACYNNLSNITYSCLGEEKAYGKVADNITFQVLDFLCSNEGFMISKMFDERGPECFQTKSQSLLLCTEVITDSIQFTENTVLSDAKMLGILDDFIKCGTQVIETCHNPVLNRIVKEVTTIVHDNIMEAALISPNNNSTMVSKTEINSTSPDKPAVLAEGYPGRHPGDYPGQRGDIWFMQKCEQSGVSYSEVRSAGMNFVECMEEKFGGRIFEEELNEARYIGDYSRVFEKYCAKTPQLKACYNNLSNITNRCLGEEKAYVKVTNNITFQVLDYLCSNDGYMISKLFNGRGLECFQTNSQNLLKCTEIITNTIQLAGENVTNDAKMIDIFDDFIKCGSRVIETCNNPVLNKIVEEVTTIVQDNISEAALTSPKNNSTVFANTKTNTTSYYRPTTFFDDNVQNKYGKNCTDNDSVQAKKRTKKNLMIASGTFNFNIDAEIFV